jgi:hypothetical protein
MISIDNTLISLDVLQRKFCCNLPACHGACCVLGDAGAPLTIEEAGDLEDYLDELRPYLSTDGLLAIMEYGAFVQDVDGEIVTPLIRKKECAYTSFENGIAFCAIEKAFLAEVVPFNKPVSCHLYPIRIKSYPEYDAVNYDQWDICGPAREEGIRAGVPVYRFVRDALIRKYGQDWFDQLDYAATHLDFSKYEDE